LLILNKTFLLHLWPCAMRVSQAIFTLTVTGEPSWVAGVLVKDLCPRKGRRCRPRSAGIKRPSSFSSDYILPQHQLVIAISLCIGFAELAACCNLYNRSSLAFFAGNFQLETINYYTRPSSDRDRLIACFMFLISRSNTNLVFPDRWRSVSTTRVHGPSSRAELTARELGCISWHPSTRAVNSGSGNRTPVTLFFIN